jgi:lipopolysaccharide export system protein LptC
VFDMAANSGVIFDKGEKIKMLGGVEMLRHETKDKKIMKLLSEEITILPNKDILLSDKKVKIIQEPNIEVDGIGLNYNKKQGIIKIIKDVKVQYVK